MHRWRSLIPDVYRTNYLIVMLKGLIMNATMLISNEFNAFLFLYLLVSTIILYNTMLYNRVA
jgi:hypothetical protein